VQHKPITENLQQGPIIGQLIDIDDQITQIVNRVTDIKIHDDENWEIEKENKFLQDISLLHSFYTQSQITEEREVEDHEDAHIVADIIDLDISDESNTKLTLNNKIKRVGKKRFTTYANQLRILKEKSSKEISLGEPSSLDI